MLGCNQVPNVDEFRFSFTPQGQAWILQMCRWTMALTLYQQWQLFRDFNQLISQILIDIDI